MAHDWGGPISLGWALEHRDQLAGVVLTNTAVSQPRGSRVPALIAMARARGVLRRLCVSTPAFLDGTLRLAHPALSRPVRDAYRAPYRGAARRQAIGDFVADIPLEPDHPSAATLQAIAAGVRGLDVPALLLWGARDPVFADRYLRDLLDRLPQADLHRFARAGHLLAEDVDIATPVAAWVGALGRAVADPGAGTAAPAASADRPLWAAIDERADDTAPAVVELSGARRTLSWAELAAASREVAAGLAVGGGAARGPGRAARAAGRRPGQHAVRLLAGGSGRRRRRRGARACEDSPGRSPRRHRGWWSASRAPSRRRARSAGPASGWSSATCRAPPAPPWECGATLDELRTQGRSAPVPPAPGADDEAAVLFTSGATGPAKGVVYRHRQLQAQRDLVAATYGVDAQRPAGRGLRTVRALRPGARHRVGRAGHGRHRARDADRHRAGRRGPRRGRDAGLRCAGSTGERGRDEQRPRRRRA